MKTENTTKSETKKEEPAYHFVRRIGQTTYRVNVHFSETSKETVPYRYILANVGGGGNRPARKPSFVKEVAGEA